MNDVIVNAAKIDTPDARAIVSIATQNLDEFKAQADQNPSIESQ